ncbi:MAG: SurA N-terminal domain-containing protein [Pseudobdellovibrio sp.]
MKHSHKPSISDTLKKGLHDRGITTRSIVAFLIFGIIVLVFILSDLSGRNKGGSSIGSAAEVNGQIISIKDFQDEETRLSQYYSQLFGGQFDMTKQQAMLRGEVMNSLVTKALASQAAEKEGIYATDAEVRHMIMEELPYFKKDGVFQSDAYKAILQANKLTPSDFEKKLRQDILGQRSRQLFEASMGVTDIQKKAEADLRSTKLNLEYVVLNADDFAKNHPVSADEIVKKSATDEFKKKIEDYFNANKNEFETKEQVKASHILIRAGTDEASIKAAQVKAEGVLARLKKEDFGKVASQVSDDPGSKSKNGDLGFFSKGSMVKEFEDAAFALSAGQTSGLVKTAYGFHIIKVVDKKAASSANLDKARMDIAKKLIQAEAFSNVTKTIETALSSGKMEEALQLVSQNKLPWKETGYFDLAAESVPVMNSTQALKVAFELNKNNTVAKKLVREGDSQFFIRFKDSKFEVTQAKDQDSANRQKSTEAYRQWIENFKKSAKIETNSNLMTAE